MHASTFARSVYKRASIWRCTCRGVWYRQSSRPYYDACMGASPGGWRLSTRPYLEVFVDQKTCVLYAYKWRWTYRSQSCFCSATVYRRSVTMVSLDRFPCLLVWGWYDVAFSSLTPKYPQTAVKKVLTNCSPLSVRRELRMPYGMLEWSRKMHAICIDAVLEIVAARVRLVYRFVLTHMYWLLWLVFDTSSSISIAWEARM